MTLRKIARILGLSAVIVCASTVGAMAGVPAAAFTPINSTNGATMNNEGWVIWNSSTTSAASVMAPFGESSGFAQTYTFYGFGNGGTLNCNIRLYDYTNHTLTDLPGSKSWTGHSTLQITFAGSSGKLYLVSARCELPAQNASGPFYLYGVR